MPVVTIDSHAVRHYAEKLGRISATAMPVTIRRTLNKAALRTKTVTMPEESDLRFNKRKPTFFKATSRVDMAKGLDVNTMQAVVGFVAPSSVKESGHATRDLEEQEHGGSIDKRAFIATDQGRTARGNVKDAFTMAKIKNEIWNSANTNIHAANNKERFIIAALYAKAYGGYLLGNELFKNGNKHLYKVLSVIRVGGNTHVSTELIYNVKGKRKAHVKATHFMEKATDDSARLMEQDFNEYALQEINKIK